MQHSNAASGFRDLVSRALTRVTELFPWDADDFLNHHPDALVLDIREPHEFDSARIPGSINVPRGILEAACDYGYEETDPQLAAARRRPILLVCRSGNRSALAADTMQEMGYERVRSLKTGLKGWNDFDLPLVNSRDEPVDGDEADEYFTPRLRAEQISPVATS